MTSSPGDDVPAPPAPVGIHGRALAQASAVAVAFFVLAGGFEAVVIRLVQPGEMALDWVSDLVLSIALGSAAYLWLKLRATRLELLERERAEVVIQTQLALAEALQRRLLPAVPPPALGFQWAAALVPAGKIGGDLYDFIAAAPHAYFLLLADVSGTGISAAMALTLVRSAFRHAARGTESPAQVAAHMSAAFYEEWQGTPYVTGIVAHVSMRARRLTYTNAGHPAGALIRDGGDRRLAEGGPPLGLLDGAEFREERLELADGDVCVFVTDGITEASDDPRQATQAAVALAVGADGGSASGICSAVMSRALHGLGPRGVEGWEDDRTVVVVALRDDGYLIP